MTDRSGGVPDADLDSILNPDMRDLARLIRENTGTLSQAGLKRDAKLKCGAATINRWKRTIEPRFHAADYKLTDDQKKALDHLRELTQGPKTEPSAAAPQSTDLSLRSSAIFEGLVEALNIKDKRLDDIAASFPGDYLAIAFSSTWPRSFTISLIHIGPPRDAKPGNHETVFTEVQINRSTGNQEIYRGVVYGHSDTRGMIGFNPTQGFVRHYVQKERSPRVGAVIWLQGFMVTTTGDQSGFQSPFFMERIPKDIFREQFAYEDEDRARRKEGSAGFLLRHICDVAPFEQIVENYQALKIYDKHKRSTAEVMANHPSALAFVRDFIQHAELHFHQAREQMRFSYGRLRPPQDDGPWMSALLRDQGRTRDRPALAND